LRYTSTIVRHFLKKQKVRQKRKYTARIKVYDTGHMVE